MTPDGELGRTIPDPVRNLPEVLFDFSAAVQRTVALGRTQVPMRLLPEVAFDLQPAPATAVLQITVSLRPDATREEVALDLFRLYAAVNRLELSDRGSGLTPYDASFEAGATGGEMRIRFTPTEPSGASERLARLVRTINRTINNPVAVEAALQYRSLEQCAAQVIQAAA
jgi:hypothetical protein